MISETLKKHSAPFYGQCQSLNGCHSMVICFPFESTTISRSTSSICFFFQSEMSAILRQMLDFEILIIGAGLSGIGAGARVRMDCPGKTFAILEGRSSSGGTWDLFRYPGVRSDSDMFTLGYRFRPWRFSKDGFRAMSQPLRSTSKEFCSLHKSI